MSGIVVIEGSLSPSGHLARGERAEVQLTPHIQRLIDGGFVTVIESRDTPAEAAAPEVEQPSDSPFPEPTAPHKGASTAAWRKWLDSQDIHYEADSGRDELVEIWDEVNTPKGSPVDPETSDDEDDSSQ